MPTHAVAKKAVIIFKMSTSLFEVSLNPRVLKRVMTLPLRVNLSANWTSAIHDSKSIPIRRFELLARLINWRQPSEFLVTVNRHTILTDIFPLPVTPKTLRQQLR